MQIYSYILVTHASTIKAKRYIAVEGEKGGGGWDW